MSKRSFIPDYDDDDDFAVVDKKSKRKMAKAALKNQQQQQQQQQQSASESVVEDDTMSKVAMLCQESKWREAVILCRAELEKAKAEGTEELCAPLEMILPKCEYSLRRQHAVAFIEEAKKLLKKEYLLNVGE